MPNGFDQARRRFPEFTDARFKTALAEIEQAIAPLLPAAEAVGVALVTGGERHDIATRARPFGGSIGRIGSAQHSETWQLPWPREPLADTWVEIRIDDATYAIELPYGVCRDETLPVPPSAPVATAPPAGIVRRWWKLDYESVPVGDVRVRFHARPEAPGILEIELYRDDVVAWSPPDVQLTVGPAGARGRRIEDWRTPDHMRRAAKFAVAPVAKHRHLAEVTVHVGSLRHTVVVPSSLLGP